MKIDELTRGPVPFMSAEFATMILMVLFPALVTVPAKWFTGRSPCRAADAMCGAQGGATSGGLTGPRRHPVGPWRSRGGLDGTSVVV